MQTQKNDFKLQPLPKKEKEISKQKKAISELQRNSKRVRDLDTLPQKIR
jgi:hypothetical protein